MPIALPGVQCSGKRCAFGPHRLLRPSRRPGRPDVLGADRLQTEGSLSSIIQAFGNSWNLRAGSERSATPSWSPTQPSNFLARAPEAAGLAFYVDSLNARSTTLQSISLDILLGAMNEDKQTIQNRLAVAAHYISQLESLNATQLGAGS